MKSIILTGSGGFVGENFLSFYGNDYTFTKYNRLEFASLTQDVIIHLAGKAHDLKNTSSPASYYQINTELTKKFFDAFIISNTKVFITLSSVKAVADKVDEELTEKRIPDPVTHYGKSKLLAEQYIFSQSLPEGKRVYVLRPCMIHGPGNKGNLNLLYNLVSKGFPWPLGAFKNRRSYLSVENLCFIIKELIEREDIPSGIYNVSDDEPLSTNELISLIATSKSIKPKIWNISRLFIEIIAKLGNLLGLPLNTERLQKLTESYVVSNNKIKEAIGKTLPVSAREGLLKTFNSFQSDAK